MATVSSSRDHWPPTHILFPWVLRLCVEVPMQAPHQIEWWDISSFILGGTHLSDRSCKGQRCRSCRYCVSGTCCAYCVRGTILLYWVIWLYAIALTGFLNAEGLPPPIVTLYVNLVAEYVNCSWCTRYTMFTHWDIFAACQDTNYHAYLLI